MIVPITTNSTKWNIILTILSMDITRPFMEGLWLPFSDVDGFIAKLRNAIVEFRTLTGSSDADYAKLEQLLIMQLGPANISCLIAWGGGLYLGYHADQPHISGWDIVASHWAYSRNKELPCIQPNFQHWYRSTYVKVVETKDVSEKAKQLVSDRLSDWDLDMYHRHQFGLSWEASPYYIIESMIRVERLKRFFRQIIGIICDADRVRLDHAATELIVDLGVWMPNKLPSMIGMFGE